MKKTPCLYIEPIGSHYRIISINNNIKKVIVDQEDLSLTQLENILKSFQYYCNIVYQEGWNNGYEKGWSDCCS